MGHVTRVGQTDTHFVADMVVSGYVISFSVMIDALRKGGSLSAMKNAWVREVLAANGALISADDLRDTAREAVLLLRDRIEPYFDEELS